VAAPAAKTSRRTDDLIDDVVRLGAHLNWQGALSLDAIATADGPVWIDVNPRVVEPGAAARDGVDLLGPLLALATGSPVGPLPIPPEPIPPEPTSPRPIPGVRTHQLLLAVLGAAESGGGRVGVAKELLLAAAGRGPYANSTEELTPLSGDPLAGIPVLVSAAACLLRPEWHRPFTHGAVSNYALTSVGWQMLLDEAR